jgi:hypothetical protein
LILAAQRGYLVGVRCLIELGANVNQVMDHDLTALLVAAQRGQQAVVRCLIEAGAEVGAADSLGFTSLLASAGYGKYSTMHFLLENGGANVEDVTNNGDTVWDLLKVHLRKIEADERFREEEEDSLVLTGLLWAMVLRSALPPALVALLSPEPARVVQEGARLRARLPAYLVRRWALLDSHCPMLLPPLRALAHGYMELTTTEELWATGLGTAP